MNLYLPKRRLSRLTLSKAFPSLLGLEIGNVIRDAKKWEVDPERTASKFDATYYRGLLEKAWGEAAFVFI